VRAAESQADTRSSRKYALHDAAAGRGVIKPCSRGAGDRACDACAGAGEGNSARIAALRHAASLWRSD
jgi:hypothetical protein